MKLIGVAGQIANGKDALADYLVRTLNKMDTGVEYPYRSHNLIVGEDVPAWERAAFGDGLKTVVARAFGLTYDFIEEWKRKEEIPEGYLVTVRRALQSVGDGFRQIKPSVWIDLALNGSTHKVVSDVRYLNEAEEIKKRGGLSVLLYRPGFKNDVDHPSESQLSPYIDECLKTGEGKIKFRCPPCVYDESINIHTLSLSDLFDVFIINDGSLEDLYRKADKFILPMVRNYAAKSKTS